jgi:hypothetical protein
MCDIEKNEEIKYGIILAFRRHPLKSPLDPYYWVGYLTGDFVHVDVSFCVHGNPVDSSYTNGVVYTAYMGHTFSAYKNVKYPADKYDVYYMEVNFDEWHKGLEYSNQLCASNIPYNYIDLPLCLSLKNLRKKETDLPDINVHSIRSLYCSQAVLLILRVMFPTNSDLFQYNSRACSPLSLHSIVSSAFIGGFKRVESFLLADFGFSS